MEKALSCHGLGSVSVVGLRERQNPIGSMGLVYSPMHLDDFYGKCGYIYHTWILWEWDCFDVSLTKMGWWFLQGKKHWSPHTRKVKGFGKWAALLEVKQRNNIRKTLILLNSSQPFSFKSTKTQIHWNSDVMMNSQQIACDFPLHLSDFFNKHGKPNLSNNLPTDSCS